MTPKKKNSMSRTPILIAAIARMAAGLHDRAAKGEPMGERELAQVVELSQRYYEILKDLEKTATPTQKGRALENT